MVENQNCSTEFQWLKFPSSAVSELTYEWQIIREQQRIFT